MNKAAIRGNSSSREALAVIVVPVELHPDSELAQVAHALNALSGHFAARESRQQQCGENSDDRNDDEQFDEGEGHSSASRKRRSASRPGSQRGPPFKQCAVQVNTLLLRALLRAGTARAPLVKMHSTQCL
jgi:hypothetical protein